MSDHGEEHGEGGGSHGGSHGGGHGGGGHAEGEHEGAPEWLISFADMVMLIMGFFVIMLAMNMGPKTTAVQGGEPGESNVSPAAPDMMDLVIALREGFNNKFDINSTRPEDQPFLRRIKERMGGPARDDAPSGKAPSVQSLNRGDSAKPTAVITFDDRSALLTSAARQTLNEAAAKFGGQRYVIEVRGHVSPFESMRQEQTARQLSYERAMAAATLLAEAGIEWELLRIVSCGAADRVVGRTFDRMEDRSNQRVELIITNELAAPDVYSAPSQAEQAAAPE
jgi:outer membrane protein OmpA-like peptidoglycan-associated protein